MWRVLSKSSSVNEARTSDASFNVAPSFARRVLAGIDCRSENSAGRLRASSSRLNDDTSHCRTLPLRCSIKFPMLLLVSFGRHQTCSSLRDSTDLRSRGQYSSKSLWRENRRNSLWILFVLVMHSTSIPRRVYQANIHKL